MDINSVKKKLRSGYTTGACAAAAAKAATLLLLHNKEQRAKSKDKKKKKDSLGSGFRALGSEVEIPFPDGSRIRFRIQDSGLGIKNNSAWASVVKDAGDDPDVTNGAKIVAKVRFKNKEQRTQNEDNKNLSSWLLALGSVFIKGGEGVGIVTKLGLPVPVGEPAINPVPRKMIKEAVMEAIEDSYKLQVTSYKLKNKEDFKLNSSLVTRHSSLSLEVTISVTDGEKLAKKTLNPRLGIIGGISILGTTGIVKPVSSEAWTATITSSMDVARAMGHQEIVLSAGRTSEKAHMKKYHFPEDLYVLMGDYLEYSLLEAKKHGFKKIHLCAQWAKMLKIAMAIPQTHVRFGVINIKKAVEFLSRLGIDLPLNQRFNTAREIFEFIDSSLITRHSSLSKVCTAAERYAKEITSRLPVISYLISYEGEIIASSG